MKFAFVQKLKMKRSSCSFVPEEETRAREIIREILEASPPELTALDPCDSERAF